MSKWSRVFLIRSFAAFAAVAAAVSSAGAAGATGAPEGSGGPTAVSISEERCAANQSAGTISYLSGFDFAAAAAIIDVVVADAKGYFDELCLDVELKPSFSTQNYTLVAANEGQFSSAGNFTEMLNYAVPGNDFLAVVNYGKAPVEALLTPADGAATLKELEGRTIGAKGDIPSSIIAMLAGAGLERGANYDEVLLDGYDPVANFATGIDALPVYKSSEPGQLDAQAIEYHLFDPADYEIPGSFGILYTSADFAAEHPQAVQDFVRAALKGMEDAVADPDGAVEIAWRAIEAAGNTSYLVLDGERYRWTHEREEILSANPSGSPVGLVDGDRFKAEYEAYVDAGVWTEAAGGPPAWAELYDASYSTTAFGDDEVVDWPGE